jgi:hypothetical protein
VRRTIASDSFSAMEGQQLSNDCNGASGQPSARPKACNGERFN